MLKSFSYLGVDLLESAIWLFLIIYLDGLTKENTLLNWTCWVVYWFYQGLTWTGVWVLAHECGHGGFVAQEWLNDTVGFSSTPSSTCPTSRGSSPTPSTTTTPTT